MCGVAGSLGRPGLVPGLLAELAHRGPDRSQVLGSGAGAVGCARLRINGGRACDMPLRSSSGRTLLAVNGEFFNHAGHPGGSTGGDLGGLPDLLETEGPAALERVRGPFALAAWDAVEETLLLARDEVGVRPLFVREVPGGVLAASEVGPLLRRGAPDRDEVAWDHLLAFQFWPPGRTPWAGVQEVEPGTWHRYRAGPRGCLHTRGRLACKDGEADLESAAAAAFALQAPCPQPAGLSLSGGLDSSAVLGGLVGEGRPPALAAVGWFPGAPPALDERPRARAAAREAGVPLLEVPITPEAWVEAWPRVVAALGGPLAGPGAVSQWLVARALGREGVRVVYSGQGGDELFGGYERHRLLLLRELGRRPVPARGYEPLARAFSDGDPVERLLLRGRSLMPFLEPGRAASVQAAARHLPPPGAGRVDRLLEFELRVLLPGLLAVEDRTMGAFGLEGRVPLLDPVLVRLARAVPLSVKSPPEEPRRLFRRLFRSRLPRAVAGRRDKMGFPVPLDAWLRGPLRSFVMEHPAWDRLPELGFRPRVRDALEDGHLPARDCAFLISSGMALMQAGIPAPRTRAGVEAAS